MTTRITSGDILTSIPPWILKLNPSACVSAQFIAPSGVLGSAVILSGESTTVVIPDVCACKKLIARGQSRSKGLTGIGGSTGQAAFLIASESQNARASQSAQATTYRISIFTGGAPANCLANADTSIERGRLFFLSAMSSIFCALISALWRSLISASAAKISIVKRVSAPSDHTNTRHPILWTTAENRSPSSQTPAQTPTVAATNATTTIKRSSSIRSKSIFVRIADTSARHLIKLLTRSMIGFGVA